MNRLQKYQAFLIGGLVFFVIFLPVLGFAKVTVPPSQERSTSGNIDRQQSAELLELQFDGNHYEKQKGQKGQEEVKNENQKENKKPSWWEKIRRLPGKVWDGVTWTGGKMVAGTRWTAKKVGQGLGWVYDTSKTAFRAATSFAVNITSKIALPILEYVDKTLSRAYPFSYSLSKKIVAQTYKAKYVNPENVEKDGVLSEWDSELDTCADLGTKTTITVKSGNGKKHILYVNGINTSYKGHCATLKYIHEVTCCDVSGIYNSTEGMLVDLWQSADDRREQEYSESNNKATIALFKNLKKEQSFDDLELWCHSQGGIICSNALKRISRNVQAKDAGFISQLNVTTFGAAAESWVTGPKYEHFINVQDLVSGDFGLGDRKGYWEKHAGNIDNIHIFSGADGKNINFEKPKRKWIRDLLFNNHFMDSTYIPAYKAYYPNACE